MPSGIGHGSGPGTVALIWWGIGGNSYPPSLLVVGGVFGTLALVFGIPSLRRWLVSSWVMRLLMPLMPRIGETERIALEAGTVWWDGDLFSGSPDWHKLLDFHVQELSPRERAFLDGPVEELCALAKEWEIIRAGDLPVEVWDFVKQNGFFGLIIPEEYGGLGFSAAAHSAVIVKLASRSVTTAVTVMVPNSLGPADAPASLRHRWHRSGITYRGSRGEGRSPPSPSRVQKRVAMLLQRRASGWSPRDMFDGKEVLGMPPDLAQAIYHAWSRLRRCWDSRFGSVIRTGYWEIAKTWESPVR